MYRVYDALDWIQDLDPMNWIQELDRVPGPLKIIYECMYSLLDSQEFNLCTPLYRNIISSNILSKFICVTFVFVELKDCSGGMIYL